MNCKYCKSPWSTSVGPGRTVGSFACSIFGIYAPIPADYEFQYCEKCKIRNLTPELERDLKAFEKTYLEAQEKAPVSPKPIPVAEPVEVKARASGVKITIELDPKEVDEIRAILDTPFNGEATRQRERLSDAMWDAVREALK